MTDLELNTVTEYHAIRAAAKALGIDKRYIENYVYLDQMEPVLGRYSFKKIGGETAVKVSEQSNSQKLEVTDLELDTVTLYPSVGSAARALGGCARLAFLYT